MAYDGSGNYSLPPGSIVSDGTTIDASDHNIPVTDIAAALSQVLLRSGVAPMTGPLDMGGFSITNQGGSNPVLGGSNNWSGTNNWTGASTMTGTGSFAIPLELRSTNADANAGPILSLYRNSASPADGDNGGAIYFQAPDSAGNKTAYATIVANSKDVTNGTEDGALIFTTLVNAGGAERMVIGAGVYSPTATGTDKGVGSINFDTVYKNGAAVATLTTDQQFYVTGAGHYTINAKSDNTGSVPVRTEQTPTSGTVYHTQHYHYSAILPGIAFCGGIRGTAGVATLEYFSASDRRLKENIVDLDNAGAVFDLLRPRRFNWRGTAVQDAGFVADELQAVIPEMVDGEAGGDRMQAIAPAKLIPFLVAEIKALRARVAALEAA